MFRKLVAKDKEELGITRPSDDFLPHGTLITVQRTRLLEVKDVSLQLICSLCEKLLIHVLTTEFHNFLSFCLFYFSYSFALGIRRRCTQAFLTVISFFSHIQQDGYEQLSLLPARTFKGLIRVRFINEQVSLCNSSLHKSRCCDWFVIALAFQA